MKNNELLIEPLTVNVKTAAKMLGICEKTLRNITKRGELPVVRIGSRAVYSREDLTEFVRQRSKRVPDNEEKNDNSVETT